MAKVFINKDLNNEKNTEKTSGTATSPLTISSLTWFQALTPKLQEIVIEGLQPFVGEIEEIRLRVKRPIIFRVGSQEMTVTAQKKFTLQLEQGYIISREEVERTVQILSQNSLYAWEDEFRNGYLTIPGGHRIGFVGRGVLVNGVIKTLKELSGVNYRIGRQILGCADEVLPFLVQKNQVYHTLIISPPQCGKTTLLRDIIRQISDGKAEISFPGVNVGLVDERSEIAGIYQGEPQFQIGLRTDVLDACPKAEGMMMLVRSMSPNLLATDEIGKKEDIEALYHALQAGVKVITTIHGSGFEEIKEKPNLQSLINWRFFERIIILSRRQGVGTIEMILDGKTLERLR